MKREEANRVGTISLGWFLFIHETELPAALIAELGWDPTTTAGENHLLDRLRALPRASAECLIESIPKFGRDNYGTLRANELASFITQECRALAG